MTTASERKTHTSDICIGGKRINYMREVARATFGESFMFIEVNTAERVFVVRIDDSVGNGVDIDKLMKFMDKYRLCRVKIYEEKDMQLFKSGKKK